jgi:hypothetical protein
MGAAHSAGKEKEKGRDIARFWLVMVKLKKKT